MGSSGQPGDRNPFARRLFPILGTAIGTVFGGPFGAAIGSAAGNQIGASVATDQFPGINVAGPGGIPALTSLFGGGGGNSAPNSTTGSAGGSGVGSIVSGIGGLFGGGGGGGGLFGGGGGNTSTASQQSGLNQLATQQNILGQGVFNQGQDIFTPAFNQFEAGATGQLTTAQQAMVGENLGQMDAATQGLYGNLGLGGSTMEGQDLNANSLRSLAETANLESQSETLGLQGLGMAGNFENSANNFFTGAARDLGSSGELALGTGRNDLAQQQLLNQAVGSLGNKSAGGAGGGSGLLGGLGSLLGGGGAGAAGDAAGVVAGPDAFDLGGAAAGVGGGDLLGAGGSTAFGTIGEDVFGALV